MQKSSVSQQFDVSTHRLKLQAMSDGQLVDETKSHLNKKKLYPDFYLTLGEWESRDLGNAFNQVAKTALAQHINHLEGLASLKEEAEEEYSRSKVA